MRHALAMNGADESEWIEMRLEDIGRAEIHGRHEGDKRAIEHDGSRMEHYALWVHAKSGGEQRAVHHPDVMGQDDAFGISGRAAAVNDVVGSVAGDVGRRRLTVGR